jgi:hypothetical protein
MRQGVGAAIDCGWAIRLKTDSQASRADEHGARLGLRHKGEHFVAPHGEQEVYGQGRNA